MEYANLVEFPRFKIPFSWVEGMWGGVVQILSQYLITKFSQINFSIFENC